MSKGLKEYVSFFSVQFSSVQFDFKIPLHTKRLLRYNAIN